MDFFAGTATTAAACIRMSRSFIGCEYDKICFEYARNRLRSAALLPVDDSTRRSSHRSKKKRLNPIPDVSESDEICLDFVIGVLPNKILVVDDPDLEQFSRYNIENARKELEETNDGMFEIKKSEKLPGDEWGVFVKAGSTARAGQLSLLFFITVLLLLTYLFLGTKLGRGYWGRFLTLADQESKRQYVGDSKRCVLVKSVVGPEHEALCIDGSLGCACSYVNNSEQGTLKGTGATNIKAVEGSFSASAGAFVELELLHDVAGPAELYWDYGDQFGSSEQSNEDSSDAGATPALVPAAKKRSASVAEERSSKKQRRLLVSGAGAIPASAPSPELFAKSCIYAKQFDCSVCENKPDAMISNTQHHCKGEGNCTIYIHPTCFEERWSEAKWFNDREDEMDVFCEDHLPQTKQGKGKVKRIMNSAFVKRDIKVQQELLLKKICDPKTGKLSSSLFLCNH